MDPIGVPRAADRHPLASLLLSALLAVSSVPVASAASVRDVGACLPESEPNDDAEKAMMLTTGCVQGTLPAGDQDLAILALDATASESSWDIELEGVPGTATLMQLFAITSGPDAAVPQVERVPLLEVSTDPGGPAVATLDAELLTAGRYLVGVTRSGLPGGGEPEDVAYTLRIRPGEPLPPNADDEPNDDIDTAAVLADAFEVSGDRQGNRRDVVAWDISTSDARWDVSLQTPPGETAWLDLVDADGSTIVSSSGDALATIYDLALPPGRYGLEVRETGDQPGPYVLRAAASDVAADPEPNDRSGVATPIAESEPVRGRLAIEGDRDRFVLTVPEGDPMLRDARMIWRSEAERSLCLLGQDDEGVVCRRGTAGINLSGLRLEPGPHVFEVSGPNDPADVYVFRIDVTGPVAADFEAEPNDEVTLANVLDPALGVRGRGGDGDADVYRLRTDGAPQVWDVEAQGSGIERLELLRPSGRVLATAQVAPDGSTARLADLSLIPGEHWLRIVAVGPEYSIAARPIGPPDPDGEREPNDEPAQSGRYRIGERVVGRLPTTSDRDVYRLTAAAAQRVRLDLQPPEDGRVRLRLWTRDESVAELGSGEAGASRSWDLWLEAGDHRLELVPETPSEGFYELTSERLDPYAGGADQEPNDDEAWARPVPASLSWSGDAASTPDTDWYLLPVTLTDEPVAIRAEGAVVRLRAQESVAGAARDAPVTLEPRDGGTYLTTSPLAPGGRLRLAVESEGPYRITLDGAGWQAQPAASPPPLEVAWSSPVQAVAAYWPQAQLVDATIDLSNASREPIEVTLETMTSHRAWSAQVPAGAVTVPAGETVRVPSPILVEPDAWGTEPVLVSVRATAVDGGTVSAATLLAATAETSAVEPRPGWDLPEPLLGGLNVAASALGSEPLGTLDAASERRLYDGATPTGPPGQANPDYGLGFSVFVEDHVEGLPLEIVVDLAGETPVPVAGTIIDPLAAQGALREMPRDFELLLSTDGATWKSALRDTVSPLPVEQAFALGEPVPATHAMLRIWSKYVDQGAYLSLGEWKVIAEPGFDFETMGRDIASPELGGHVVAFEPFDPDPEVARSMLDTTTERRTVEVGEALALEVTVGFDDGRAARISEVGWQDPEATDPDARPGVIDVYASRETPSGPWRFLGTWSLERKPDGTVPAFVLEEPEWARFVRLRGRIPAGASELELPARITVREQATDAAYRSVVAEWGERTTAGPLEASTQAVAATPVEIAHRDAGDALTQARELQPGAVVAERVEIGTDEDWFTVEIPADHDTLDLTVGGRPFVGVALRLVDDSGTEMELPFRTAPDGSVRYRASVEPGARYGIEVEQPPFSVVFAFDTSRSIEPFLDQVIAGIRSFLSDVQPGREVATLLPFDEAPLIDGWSDDRYALQDAFENHVIATGGSSSAESALISASSLLAQREGARAVLLVTDGETTSYERTPELWDALAQVRPIVFSVHIGALLEPVASRQRMQDWALGGGHYSYPTTAGEMDQAFERLATWLRRPAAYTLSVDTRDTRPASLAVVPGSDASGRSAALPVAPGVGVEIILDTSGSMRKRLSGKRRLEVAKAALRELLNETLAEGTPVAMRTFGAPGRGRKANCGTTLTLPLGPLQREQALKTVRKLGAGKNTGTPIAAALDAVPSDLAEVNGLRSVVLITDGAASCDGDPRTSIEALRGAGVEVKLDVVGFALQDEALKAEMAQWAALGGGAYYDAGNARQLSRSVASALSAPFRVSPVDGGDAITGTVGGPPLELEPGRYRVEILTEPPRFIDEVELANGQRQVLTVDLAPEPR